MAAAAAATASCEPSRKQPRTRETTGGRRIASARVSAAREQARGTRVCEVSFLSPIAYSGGKGREEAMMGNCEAQAPRYLRNQVSRRNS